ncbi:hypothetical protein HCN44_001823 [Aphidius gifuensis]|uniref:Uncharacterized protein n=1 Tax=Aphidius gifuensis TaxID=684658 RepID=A0A834Y0A0_APHGI|nr:toll-like receptor 7 [Aphidius gifuensis]KAF7996191.1 hypothetical protein HCN44_001823 [Aphidius gifuensis]
MKIYLISLLLLCESVFINSLAAKKISNCDKLTYPGFKICNLSNKTIFIEHTKSVNNLTILNNEIDTIASKIFTKFSPENFYFQLFDRGTVYIRNISRLNGSNKLLFYGMCMDWRLTLNNSLAYVNPVDLIKNNDVIIDGSEDLLMKIKSSKNTNMIGSVLVQNNFKKINLMNGLCNTLPKIQTLTIRNYNSTSIEPIDFDLYKNIIMMEIYLHKVESLPSNIFNQFKHLQKLFITSPKVTSLPKDIFNNVKLLIELSADMSLTSLESGIFDGLYHLKKLTLFDNELESLPNEIFKDLYNLEFLELIHGEIWSLEANGFSNLNKLKYLDLSRNRLTQLSKNIFNGLNELEDLRIRWNGLRTIESSVFNGLHKLKSLKISCNRLGSVPRSLFATLDALLVLDLKSNRLTNINPGVFQNLHNLEVLDLSHNRQTHIDINLFRNLKKLRVLNLGYNSLTIIGEKSLQHLEYLQKLYLNNNEISVIEFNALPVKSVKHLNLKSNELTHDSLGKIKELTKLETVNLRSNKFSTLPDGIFRSCKKMKNVYI